MPGNLEIHGLKIYVHVDSALFFTMNLELYLDKQPEGLYKIDNSILVLVCRLMEPVRGSKKKCRYVHFFYFCRAS